jgi:hypothetical protein
MRLSACEQLLSFYRIVSDNILMPGGRGPAHQGGGEASPDAEKPDYSPGGRIEAIETCQPKIGGFLAP